MKNKLQEIFGKALFALRQFPMVLLMALTASLCLILMAEEDFRPTEKVFTLTKVAIVSALGISLMFALKILSQRMGKQFLLELGGVLLLIGFYFLLPEREKDFTEVYAFMIVPAFVLSHLLVSFAAFFRNSGEKQFWQYNKNLFINIFLTAVFTGVLTGGVELAILAVDQLFDFNFSDYSYLRVFYLFAIFGSCYIFLLFDEKGLEYLEKESDYPVVLKFFTQYILIPLLMIYVVILYFYAGKILFSWQLPKGWVTYLVLAYSIVGILANLLVYPLKEQSTKSWVRMFSRIFYFTLIPLLILLFIAIFTRILEYGYTEPRYFVVLLSVWLATVVVYFIVYKKSSIKFIPVSLFAFGLFALIFPYLNTFSVAKRSQKNQLIKVLTEHKLLDKNHKIDFSRPIADSIATEISNKFGFLTKRHETDFLVNLIDAGKDRQLLRDMDQATSEFGTYYSTKNHFTNIKTTNASVAEFEIMRLVANQEAVSTKGYDFMFYFNRYNHPYKTIGGDKFEIFDRVSDQEPELKVLINNEEEIDFSPLIVNLKEKYSNQKGTTELPEIAMEADAKNYHLKLVLGNLQLEKRRKSRTTEISYDDAYLLIRKK